MNSRTRPNPFPPGVFQETRATQSQVPRHADMGFQMTSDMSVDYDVMENYTLSSGPSSTGRRQGSHVGPWISSLPEDDDYSFAQPVSAVSVYDNMDSTFLPDMMMMAPAGCDVLSDYDVQPDNAFSRLSQEDQFRAPLHYQGLPQANGLVSDVVPFSMNPSTANQAYCSPSVHESAVFRHGYPSPPLTNSSSGNEETFQSGFQLPGALTGMSTSPVNRHGVPVPGADENPSFELIGPSQLKQYSGPIRSANHPRPLRSALERDARLVSSQLKATSLTADENNESQTPRRDPRYERKPDKDGFYRCPFKDEQGCTHKPTRQKCIYAKYLDSHIRPYRCKVPGEDCRDKYFSSNACLFRHEREAHGLHGHGENPNLCHFDTCERSRPGNGFPRKWNLGDHMKRVHNYDVEKDSSSDRHGNIEPLKKRKGSASSSGSVQMKRTTSSHAKAQVASAAYSRDGRDAPSYSRPVHQVSGQKYAHAPPSSGHFGTSYALPLDNIRMSPQYARHSAGYQPGDYYQPGYPF